MIPELRGQFNAAFHESAYSELLILLDQRCGGPIQFPVAETPIFVPRDLLDEMAEQGSTLALHLIADAPYLAAARKAIPHGYSVVNETPHPHFLTADFALVRTASGELAPRLVEIQAFPSVFAYQAQLCSAYREVFGLPESLGVFLGGLNESTYWNLLRRTILGNHKPEEVVLTEIDPLHQKTFSDFHLTSKHLGIPVVDIAAIESVGNKLHYRDAVGCLRPIHRIYNRAIADELIARHIRLPFNLAHPWEVEWAGHPNWYFLISKFSIPWLARTGRFPLVPPAVFLNDFLAGPGHDFLAAAGVPLPTGDSASRVYKELLLKPLYSFAGKGIEFEPSHARLQAIPPEERESYLLQQRMRFEPTIETPFGWTQAEIRILYMWPDGGELTPALSLVRLGRGKMMGVDHNKNRRWVGGSAAFYI
ncbi:MAG: hypothetical protein WCA10_24985 [Terracidiphilus sp.]